MSDRRIAFPPDVLWPEVPADERDAFLSAFYQPADNLSLQLNALVIDLNGKRILIDAGSGRSKFQPTAGALPENLRAAGIDPATIDTVVFTHLHPDHLWGVTDADNGALTFPNAGYVASEADVAFWYNSDLPQGSPDEFKRAVAEGTLAHLAKIKDRLRVGAAAATSTAGVTFVPTPGHTPGHVSIMLESDGETLLVSGDVIGNPFVSLERPDWGLAFDVDMEQGTASRHTFLDQAATDRHRVLSYHMPWPGLGYVARAAGAYRWIEEDWIW